MAKEVGQAFCDCCVMFLRVSFCDVRGQEAKPSCFHNIQALYNYPPHVFTTVVLINFWWFLHFWNDCGVQKF